jgi:hypothetical protein
MVNSKISKRSSCKRASRAKKKAIKTLVTKGAVKETRGLYITTSVKMKTTRMITRTARKMKKEAVIIVTNRL